MVLFYLIGTVRFTEAFGACPVAFFLLTGESRTLCDGTKSAAAVIVRTAVSTKITEKGGKTKT